MGTHHLSHVMPGDESAGTIGSVVLPESRTASALAFHDYVRLVVPLEIASWLAVLMAMLGSAATDAKVLWSVILCVPVYMMDMLHRLDDPPYLLGRYQPMLVHIAPAIGHRVPWPTQQYISVLRDDPAASPVRVVWAKEIAGHHPHNTTTTRSN